MAIFYLVRHGEPDYAALEGSAFFGFERDFAPLSKNGIRQARKAAKDERFKNAERIVSSPYTRALQTAQIIAENAGTRQDRRTVFIHFIKSAQSGGAEIAEESI